MTAECTIIREIALLRRAQKTARTVSGHKTDSVFSRYNIVSDADIRDAARKIEEGAQAAVSGSIHSSFTAGSSEGPKVGQSEAKPLYNQ